MNFSQLYDTLPADMEAEMLLLEIEYERTALQQNAALLNMKAALWPDPCPFVTANDLAEDGNLHYFRFNALLLEADRRHLSVEKRILGFEYAPANEPEAPVTHFN